MAIDTQTVRKIAFLSHLKIEDDKIAEMDEYWADDGEAPDWRREMKIGKPIRNAVPGGPET